MKRPSLRMLKRIAHAKVTKAIRDGRLKPKSCMVCEDAGQAHHEDYHRPLHVLWLCPRHHARRHAERAMPITEWLASLGTIRQVIYPRPSTNRRGIRVPSPAQYPRGCTWRSTHKRKDGGYTCPCGHVWDASMAFVARAQAEVQA